MLKESARVIAKTGKKKIDRLLKILGHKSKYQNIQNLKKKKKKKVVWRFSQLVIIRPWRMRAPPNSRPWAGQLPLINQTLVDGLQRPSTVPSLCPDRVDWWMSQSVSSAGQLPPPILFCFHDSRVIRRYFHPSRPPRLLLFCPSSVAPLTFYRRNQSTGSTTTMTLTMTEIKIKPYANWIVLDK